MKVSEKRRPRTYKIADKPYNRAKKRAAGELAPMIENFVKCYAWGCEIHIFDVNGTIMYVYPPKSKQHT